MRSTAFDRFFARVVVEATPSAPNCTPCWWWIGARSKGGEDESGRNTGADFYGHFWDGGKVHRAHKWLWEKMHGKKVPRGKHLGHSCNHTLCVNYNHVSPQAAWVNVAERNARYDYSQRRKRRVA